MDMETVNGPAKKKDMTKSIKKISRKIIMLAKMRVLFLINGFHPL